MADTANCKEVVTQRMEVVKHPNGKATDLKGTVVMFTGDLSKLMQGTRAEGLARPPVPRHLIVGNGRAGVAAAQALPRPDPRGDHRYRGAHFFLFRPGLMYYMMGQLKEWDLRLAHDDGFYRGLGVDLVYDRATALLPGTTCLSYLPARASPSTACCSRPEA